jgi:hypothetical protein
MKMVVDEVKEKKRKNRPVERTPGEPNDRGPAGARTMMDNCTTVQD